MTVRSSSNPLIVGGGAVDSFTHWLAAVTAISTTSTACTARGYDPTFYTDLNLRWRVNDVLEVRGGITNAFNQDPRFAATASSSQGQTDASTYDLLGRSYFVALKARF